MPCNYVSYDKNDSKSKSLQRNKATIKDGSSAICLKIKSNQRKPMPIVKNTSSDTLILESNININDARCSDDLTNANTKVFSDDKSRYISPIESIAAGKHRRGKRSLSSTRLRREVSDDNSLNQKKPTTVRSLVGIYSTSSGISDVNCSHYLTEPLPNKKNVCNTELRSTKKYSSSTCNSHAKLSSKNEITPSQIVLRIRKR